MTCTSPDAIRVPTGRGGVRQVPRAQDGSATATRATGAALAPCALAVPSSLMTGRAGTLTQDEYLAWYRGRYGR